MTVNKYSIINSVPQNSGDFALLEALLFYIKSIDPQSKIVVYSDSPEFLNNSSLNIWSNKLDLHHLPIPKWLNVLFSYLNKLLSISLNKILLKKVLFFKEYKKQYFKDLASSKLVISSPGGYLHDYYNNEERFYILERVATDSSLVLLGQSIGPFWKEKSSLKMLNILHACKHMIFRESVSSSRYNTDKDINQSLCSDIAFLLHSKYQLFKLKKETFQIQNIVVSFREWNSTSNASLLVSKAVAFCNYLIDEKGKSISFLSTCQGLENYTDDLKIANEVLKGIKNKNEFDIISGYHTPRELILLYQQFDLYVGMRMHGAILSLIGGTPAINIGYEDKSLGLFRDLGLEDHYVDHKNNLKNWKQVFENTESKYRTYASSIKQILDHSNHHIFTTLNHVFE